MNEIADWDDKHVPHGGGLYWCAKCESVRPTLLSDDLNALALDAYSAQKTADDEDTDAVLRIQLQREIAELADSHPGGIRLVCHALMMHLDLNQLERSKRCLQLLSRRRLQ